MDQSFILFAVLLFVAVVLGLEGLYQSWAAKNSAESRRLASRLYNVEAGHKEAPLSIERIDNKGRFAWLDDDVLGQAGIGRKLTNYVRTGDAGVSAGELLVASAVLGIVGYVLPAVFANPVIFSMLLAVVLATLPWLWLMRKRSQRIRLFERQIPEALDLMGRALRAGHALPTAVKMVADEMPDPIARDFRILFDETNFGIPQNEALMRLAERVPVDDLKFFVIAVMIQRESGGNLAELLDNISAIVRARLKLLGEVRTLSAEGKMSAWVLGLLPFAVGLVISIVHPTFMEVLWTDPMGLNLVGIALMLMVLGAWWMSRIIKIRI